MISRTALIALAALALARPAAAEILDKTGKFNGGMVDYKVLLPPGYDKTKAYPAVLVFTGGDQSLRGALATLQQDWQSEAEKRGYIVISPAAPEGEPYYASGDQVFPAFLDAMSRTYRIAGKWHIAGHSNGGLSAFHIAARWPNLFSTVTGYPGLLDEGENPAGLKPMCLYMHAGEHDELGWATPVKQQAEQLKAQGYKVQFTLEKGQGHRLKAKEIDLSRRLFDEIESCK